jgi:thiol-disulfide isomerase/thioredoxin
MTATAKTNGVGRVAKGLALAALFVLPAFAATTSSGPAPAFQLSGRGGKAIDLSQFKGQVVMINFWATWCGPCRQEMPLLEDIYKKYKPMGFTLVGVNVEPDAAGAEAWLSKQKPVSFPIAFDTESKVSKMYKGRRHAEHRVRRSQGQHPCHAQGLQARRREPLSHADSIDA